MNFAQRIDFNSLMEPVALRLLGEPAQKQGNEWRYGNRGSLSIDLSKGSWFDHEANVGGGVFALIQREGHEQPAAWLRSEGLLAAPQIVRPPQPRIVKTYDYRDETGKLLFQVVRYEPKAFRQRRPDGRGGWVRNLDDTRRVPYSLSDLIKAVAAGETIYIPEGEKDADNLRAIGLAATTNPGGTKKWRDEYSQHLRGADVVVLPDNHAEGREHGDQVVASLRGIAKRIRVLDIGKHWTDCPNKGDISNWLAAGGSAEKLKAIVDALPETSYAIGDDVEIERLARLPLLEYGQQRKAAAKKLRDIPVGILDKVVQAERTRLGLDGGDDRLQGTAISFPEPEAWPEPLDGAELLDEIANALRKYVVLSDRARDTTAIWTLHTYLIDRFLVSPRLGVCSPTKQCGKTTLLDVLSRLVLRPLATGSVTPAAVFRVIEGYKPTLLIDEADTFLRDDDGLRGVLNGNRKGSQVLRTVGDEHEVRAFATYSAVVIALIGTLPDTLHDRSTRVELKRRLPTETVEAFRPDRADNLDVLARKAARWAQDHAESIAAADPAMPDGIINREADNWRPLVAIADQAGGEWPQRARDAAMQAHIAAADDDASRLELLLSDIRSAFGEKTEISSADLVKVLVGLDGRPWAEMGKSHKPLTPNKLARMLKPLGITPDTIREGDTTFKGYHLHRFQEAFERYLPPEGVSEPSHRNKRNEMGTSGPSQT